MLILKNSSLLSINQFLSTNELYVFNIFLFYYKALKQNKISIIDLKNKIDMNYPQNSYLKKIINQLSDKKCQLDYINKLKLTKSKQIKLFKDIIVENNIITFKFHKNILEFINNKNNSFYHLNISTILPIKRVSSITFYELLIDFTHKNKNETTLYFNLKFLRRILGFSNKYKKNSEFKTKVINKIFEDLNNKFGIQLFFLQKRNIEMVKCIISSIPDTTTNDILTNWFINNNDEIELYKQTLIESNNTLKSTEIIFDSISSINNSPHIIFKYKTFLLEVEILDEDLDIIKQQNKKVITNV